MKLNELSDNQGARKERTRVGRGIGSGKGKTCGSGQKGQKSRSGVAIKGFGGEQSNFIKQMPKKGFKNYGAKKFAVINLDLIQEAIDSKKISIAKPIDAAALLEVRMIRNEGDGLRLLAGINEFKSKANFVVTKASAGAMAAVEKAGGKVEVLPEKENKLLKPGKILKKEKRKTDAIAKAEARAKK